MEKASGDLLIFWMDISREHAKSKPSDMPQFAGPVEAPNCFNVVYAASWFFLRVNSR